VQEEGKEALGRRGQEEVQEEAEEDAMKSAAVILSAIASLALPGVASAAVVDASCPGPPGNTLTSGNAEQRFAQTFSPVNGGYLTEVRLFVTHSSPSSNFLVQITPVDGNLVPVDTVLAQATAADSSVPIGLGPQPLAAHFATPPPVDASGEYAIVLKRPGGDLVGIGFVEDAAHDPCPDGVLYRSPSSADPWEGLGDHVDAVFTTFVRAAQTPTPLPQSPAAPQSLAGSQPTTKHRKCRKAKRKRSASAARKNCKKKKRKK
jgi:hypothetical protein